VIPGIAEPIEISVIGNLSPATECGIPWSRIQGWLRVCSTARHAETHVTDRVAALRVSLKRW